jgi:hypothetical protein
MTDWEVTVVTDSNYIKKVRVDDCITRKDAEAAALGMTGAQRVIVSTPKTYKDTTEDYSSSSTSSSSGDGDLGGFVILGIVFLIFALWKIILLVGGIALAIWLIMKYAMRDTY